MGLMQPYSGLDILTGGSPGSLNLGGASMLPSLPQPLIRPVTLPSPAVLPRPLPSPALPPASADPGGLPPRYQEMLARGVPEAQVLARAAQFARNNPESLLGGRLLASATGGGLQQAPPPPASPEAALESLQGLLGQGGARPGGAPGMQRPTPPAVEISYPNKPAVLEARQPEPPAPPARSLALRPHEPAASPAGPGSAPGRQVALRPGAPAPRPQPTGGAPRVPARPVRQAPPPTPPPSPLAAREEAPLAPPVQARQTRPLRPAPRPGPPPILEDENGRPRGLRPPGAGGEDSDLAEYRRLRKRLGKRVRGEEGVPIQERAFLNSPMAQGLAARSGNRGGRARR